MITYLNAMYCESLNNEMLLYFYEFLFYLLLDLIVYIFSGAVSSVWLFIKNITMYFSIEKVSISLIFNLDTMRENNVLTYKAVICFPPLLYSHPPLPLEMKITINNNSQLPQSRGSDSTIMISLRTQNTMRASAWCVAS